MVSIFLKSFFAFFSLFFYCFFCSCWDGFVVLCLVVVALKRRAARSREPKKTARRLIVFFFSKAALLGNFSETFRKRFGHFRNASETFRKRYGNFSETFRKLFVNFSETFRKLFGNFWCVRVADPLAGANQTQLAEFISQVRIAVFLNVLKELHALSLYPKAPNLKVKPKLEVQTV